MLIKMQNKKLKVGIDASFDVVFSYQNEFSDMSSTVDVSKSYTVTENGLYVCFFVANGRNGVTGSVIVSGGRAILDSDVIGYLKVDNNSYTKTAIYELSAGDTVTFAARAGTYDTSLNTMIMKIVKISFPISLNGFEAKIENIQLSNSYTDANLIFSYLITTDTSRINIINSNVPQERIASDYTETLATGNKHIETLIALMQEDEAMTITEKSSNTGHNRVGMISYKLFY